MDNSQPKTWWKRTFLTIPIWVYVVVVVVIAAIGVTTLTKGDDDTTTPATIPAGTEACAAIADPANAKLHPSDWRRIGHWTQSEMEAYVSAHCPEELSRVRD